MNIDFSGLESSASFCGANTELFDGFSTTPSFQIPDTTDVSLISYITISGPSTMRGSYIFVLIRLSLCLFVPPV